MLLVQRLLEGADILQDYPNLAADVARAEARPAYQRVFAAQLDVFRAGKADD